MELEAALKRGAREVAWQRGAKRPPGLRETLRPPPGPGDEGTPGKNSGDAPAPEVMLGEPELVFPEEAIGEPLAIRSPKLKRHAQNFEARNLKTTAAADPQGELDLRRIVGGCACGSVLFLLGLDLDVPLSFLALATLSSGGGILGSLLGSSSSLRSGAKENRWRGHRDHRDLL